MLATLFLVAGTALGCVYGIKESNIDDGFDAPSFLGTPCVLEGGKRSAGDSCLLTGVPASDELASLEEENSDNVNEFADLSMAMESSANTIQASSKLAKLTSGDAHKDLYRFSTREKLRFDFSVKNPSNYKFQVRRYQRKTTKFVCESLKSFSVELLPATYYLHVEDESGSTINSSSYEVDFSTKRISNYVPFSGSCNGPFK